MPHKSVTGRISSALHTCPSQGTCLAALVVRVSLSPLVVTSLSPLLVLMRIPVGIAIANAWDVLAGAELDHFMVEVVEDHGFVVEGRWHLSAQHSIHRLFPVDVSHAKRRVSIALGHVDWSCRRQLCMVGCLHQDASFRNQISKAQDSYGLLESPDRSRFADSHHES